MKTFRNQAGSSHLVLFLGLAVVVAVAIVGYRVVKNNEPSPVASSQVTQPAAVPASIKNQADLVKAQNALDQTSIDNSVNPDQLNNDLNSLL